MSSDGQPLRLHDNAPDRFPENSAAARCILYGHVLIDHELLGRTCMRCGGYDPAWRLTAEGSWR